MRSWIFRLSIALSIACISCTSTPEPGWIYTNNKYHLSTDPAGHTVTSARILKKGESCTFGSVLFYFGYYGQQVSLKETLLRSKISKVALVDRSTESYLMGLVYFDCVEVWGE
ncbi:TRL-like family protein [Leptospira broomii serovar Hurstbridge str. 5399]|uniref:TRL-like family protein n=1 Tax=Leptospira broomii serovar Hurstbridge str. 5399 TaxID=1049789 RepID=T0FB95_9LEPT|nr:TRL domain-containing protein [Leptospira broomii]EQA44857.1 TRL-like family protein [Leptospira broomii serovar Hurstbridge str. 5399]